MARGKFTQGFRYIRRKGLTLFPVKDLTRDQWLELRKMGGTIGGSDVGTILGWNPWYSAVRLFYQKLGLDESSDTESEAAYWGTQHEPVILRNAQHYDFNEGPNQYKENARAGILVKKITPFKYSVRNPKYPFANANVDGLIDFDAKKFIARRLFEAKSTKSQAVDQWENNIPPYHLGQVMLYLTVLAPMLEEQVAEIYYLIDGSKFVGYEIQNAEGLRDIILEACNNFYEKVQKGLEIVANEPTPELRDKALWELQPPPDATLSYEDFMSENHKRKASYVRILGTREMMEVALAYKDIARQEKELKGPKQLRRNQIWETLSREGANVIDFGPNGKITYSDKLYVNVHQ